MIGGFRKYYGGDIDSILNMSYRNILLYNAVIPSSSIGKAKNDERKIDASDPKNKEAAHKIMFG